MSKNTFGTVLLLLTTSFVFCLERSNLIVDEYSGSGSSNPEEEIEEIIPKATLIRQGGWSKITSNPFDGLFLQFQPDTLIANGGFRNSVTYRSWKIVGDTIEAYRGSASSFRSLCYQITYKPVAPGADIVCPPSEKICRPDTLYARECGEEEWEAFVYEWQDNH